MKRIFEFILVLIIFYGVYAASEQIAPFFFNNIQVFWLVVISLIISTSLLLGYAVLVRSEITHQMKKDIDLLEVKIKEKDLEIKKAQSFKEDLISEAEKTYLDN